jgi:hypothetical protein
MRALAPKRTRSHQAARAAALSNALAPGPARQARPVPFRSGGSGHPVALRAPLAGDFSRIPPHSPVALAQAGLEGGGEPLPHLAEIQRLFGRHDISPVVAHIGSRASAAARALGASAYTTGGRTAFAGPPDLRMAAHEAAHVVQQRAHVHFSGDLGEAGDVYERHANTVAEHVGQGRSAEALLDQMAPAGSPPAGARRQVVQRAPIKTDYGEFDTTKYDAVGPAGSEYGLDTELTFDPDKTKVDAKKIGLTQTARSQLAGAAIVLEPSRRGRVVASGTGEGREIDRTTMGAYGNPLYAADAPGPKDALGDTPTVAGWGQHGWNYKEKSGAAKHQIAKLIDRATLPGHGKNAAQTFETAALAVEGTQSGTYMGSVSWGWRVDGAGKFSKLPLSRVSKGNPSADFIAAAKQWNKWVTAGTIKTTPNPTNVYDATYAVAFTVSKDTEVQVTDGSYIHGDEPYSPVSIKSGPQVGKSGRIKVADLRDVGGGSAAIKLPIP